MKTSIHLVTAFLARRATTSTILLLLGLASPIVMALTPSTGHAQPADPTLMRYRGTLLYGKWGMVSAIQEAIKSALTGCSQPAIEADGIFGNGTREGLRRLGSCPNFQNLGLKKGEINDGTITEKVWKALLDNRALPPIHDRAFTSWLMHEATDFDKAEFNFIGSNGEPQPNDPASYLTWGPYGATVGHGREVQHILQKVSSSLPCFGTEQAEIQRLLVADDADARQIVQKAFIAPARRAAWKAGFSCLGAIPEVRSAYDEYAFHSENWLKPALKRVYQLIPSQMAGGTDIDYAFFVDIVMHMSVSNNLMEITAKALQERGSAIGRALTPAERRQVIGQTFVGKLSNQVEDRRGRNVLYYVDGVGDGGLTPTEVTAWRNRSSMRASDFGLREVLFKPSLD